AVLTPGVTTQAPGTQAGGINVAGMRSQSNNFTLDGASINDPQVNGPLNGFHIADAVQEFNVNTSIAGTDLGRSSGAQVAAITKSGGNAYHGSAFFFGRNEALDANDWFLNNAGKPRNVLRREQYGATVGGWVVKDKTFWFLSFEGFREKSPIPQLSIVPTAAERAVVTDPVSQRLLQFIPSPNIANALPGQNNWAGTVDQNNNNDTFLLRIDHTLSANNHIMGHYANVRGTTLSLQQNPFDGSITNLPGSQSAIIEETYSHGNWLNVARIGFTRNVTDFGPQDVKVDPATIFTDASGNPLPGFVDTTTNALNGGLPRITISSSKAVPLANFGLGAGTNMPQGRTTDTYQLIDNVTKNLGAHTLQFGGEIRREETFRFLNGNFRGAISFQDWQHFADGVVKSGALRTGGPDQTFRSWNRYADYMYIQDSWKMRPNFTFNYGVRYELPGALAEKRNSGSNFVPGVGVVKLDSNLVLNINPNVIGPSALSMVPTPGDFLPASGQFHGSWKDFAPFIGMAWSPKIFPAVFGDGKTVIRTGFRLSYDDVFANIPVNMGLNFPPVLSTTLPNKTCNLPCNVNNPANTVNPANSAYTWGLALNQDIKFVNNSGLGILSINGWDTTGKTAYAMNYALEIERQVGKEYAFQASYIGTLGRRLGVFVDANEPVVNGANRTFPFPQLAGLPVGSFASSSNYNAVVLSVKKRSSYGLTLQGSYTYAKSLDYNSSFFGSTGETGAFADPRNPQLDYGPSAFDIRNQLTIAYLYELPIGKGRMFMRNPNPVVQQFLGGWNMGGITTWHTGFPYTLLADPTTDFSGFNQFADRPNLVGTGPVSVNYSDPTKPAFNVARFTPPGPGSIGNVGRNSLNGPSFTDFDLSLQKNFPVTESKKFQLRADMFNLFNHPNFGLPISNLASAAAGTITSISGNSRLLQLGLRFDW
ncbi:MAG TPA: hypothetical protein VKZ53_08710, partial [Candidatus Angelobacter sp.]|nr:hypothetical protein [Candidatus Angelobacter sp.]